MVQASDIDAQKRLRLAEIARQEANLRLAGNADKGGPQIEKYLASLRPAFTQRERSKHLVHSQIGFDWCGAFVYYCCRQAGYTFSGRPSDDLPGTFAAVFIWPMWATKPENDYFVPANKTPQVGDIVIFDRLLEDVECDHVGIVTVVKETTIETAEGNVHNQAGLFCRSRDDHIHGYIRLRG
ncbi:MAG: CHAP domain-containing protein [Chloroflexota bacterium]